MTGIIDEITEEFYELIYLDLRLAKLEIELESKFLDLLNAKVKKIEKKYQKLLS